MKIQIDGKDFEVIIKEPTRADARVYNQITKKYTDKGEDATMDMVFDMEDEILCTFSNITKDMIEGMKLEDSTKIFKEISDRCNGSKYLKEIKNSEK